MQVTRETHLKTNPNKALDYIAQVSNHPAFLSALKSIHNISGDPKQAGSSWDWTFEMAGVQIQGSAETVEYTPGEHYSFKTTTGIVSTFSYKVSPDGDGIKLTVSVDYSVPDSVLAKIADQAAIERLNENEADQSIENLKVILES